MKRIVIIGGVAGGMSAATRSRNVGAAADPLPGPAKTRFADSLTSATVIVPAVVIVRVMTGLVGWM